MKRNFPILIVVIITFACFLQVICGGNQVVATGDSNIEPTAGSAKAKTTTKGPAITFEKVVHDFGDIGPGSENIWEFKFTNTGDKLLKIARVRKTCGCTPYELAKKQYAPGESGTLKVRYKASSRPDSEKKTLTVYSNDWVNSEVKLTIKARILQRISHFPKSIDFLLNKENAGCPEITIKSLDDKPFSITGVKTKWRSRAVEGGITADYDPSKEAKEFVLHPKVDMEKLKQESKGHIEITLTHPESGSVAIPFKVLPKFKVTPPSIIVYKAEPGVSVTREVWVLSNYDEDFEIESTATQKGAIKVLSQEKIDNRYKFELEITPPAVGKIQKRSFTDELFINIKDGEKLEITCRLFYSREA